jgi:hypothetical protein
VTLARKYGHPQIALFEGTLAALLHRQQGHKGLPLERPVVAEMWDALSRSESGDDTARAAALANRALLLRERGGDTRSVADLEMARSLVLEGLSLLPPVSDIAPTCRLILSAVLAGIAELTGDAGATADAKECLRDLLDRPLPDRKVEAGAWYNLGSLLLLEAPVSGKSVNVDAIEAFRRACGAAMPALKHWRATRGR